MTAMGTDTISLPVEALPGDAEAPTAGMRRRRRYLTGIVLTAVLAGAAGAGAAAILKSPAQIAAETSAPAPDTLTASVERRVVAEALITRGKVSTASTTDIAALAPSGVEGARPMVTKVNVRPGDQLQYGKVLFEISGRPVFTLSGAIPAYRDLKPGLKGEDVTQLQKALSKAGFRTSPDSAGTFGAGTTRAVAAFYKSIGYSPVLTIPAEPADKPKAPAPAPVPSGGPKAETAPTDRPSTPPPVPLVPMSEVIYIGELPARVDLVSAKVGTAPGEKLMTVSTGDLVVSGDVSPREKGLLRSGQKVDILAESTGQTLTGTVLGVDEATAPDPKGGQGATGSPTYTLRVKPDQPLPVELAGREVRLTVKAASSDGPVLAVPSAALFSGADGNTTVVVLQPDGALTRVAVRPGMSGDGFVEVTPSQGAALSPGDKVVVGAQAGSGSRP